MIIPRRFNGPPGSGNGGYSSGLIASYVAGGSHGVEVTLRRPPPLDTELSVRRDGVRPDGVRPDDIRPDDIRPDDVRPDDLVRVFDGPDLIAEATARPVAHTDAVAPVTFDEAVEASRSYPGFAWHPFPTCFVCGPARKGGDGLRLFPGRLADGRVAAPFVIPDDICEAMIWACLDCPSGWAVSMQTRPYVLGRIAVRVDAKPNPGDACVVMGLMTGEEGRKANARSTLYSPAGVVLAIARATWIAMPAI
jgi:hypothetical protein